MKQLLLFFVLLSCGYLYSQDCYSPTMQLGRKFFAEAKYQKATKQFKAALACEDKPVLADSVKVVESWIKRSDSMEVVSIIRERDKAISALLTVKANQAVEKGDVTKSFRYAQYALEKDNENNEAQAAFYRAIFQTQDKPLHYFYREIRSTDYIANAAFSPDGKKIASTYLDNTLKIWDTYSGKLLIELWGHDSNINVVFSPDGKKIITSYDKTIKIWDSETGELLADLQAHKGGIIQASFSPDMKRIISTSNDKTVKIWLISIPDIIAELNDKIADLTPEENAKYGIE